MGLWGRCIGTPTAINATVWLALPWFTGNGRRAARRVAPPRRWSDRLPDLVIDRAHEAGAVLARDLECHVVRAWL